MNIISRNETVVGNKISVYGNKAPDWQEDTYREYLRNPKGVDFQETKSTLVYRNDQERLELYHASSSVWWTDLAWENEDLHQIAEIPGEQHCLNAAEEVISSMGLGSELLSFESLDFETVQIFNPEKKEFKKAVAAINVNYRYTIDGLPVFGPGAKVKVTLDEDLKPVEWFQFWLEIELIEKREFIGKDAALELVQRSTMIRQIRVIKKEYELFSPKLGYYASPPRSGQRFLYPVYRICGQVLDSKKIDQPILEYVPAVLEHPDRLKELGLLQGDEFCQDIYRFLK